MARKPTGKPTGRPPKPIDWQQFEQCCALQCTQPEVANMLKVDEDTIRERVKKEYGDEYSVIYKRFADAGKCSLRRNQFVLSKKNASMAIWLGKIWLGQKDTQVDETNDSINGLRKTLFEILHEGRVGSPEQSGLENKQPIQDQECRRKGDEVLFELGAEGLVEGNE